MKYSYYDPSKATVHVLESPTSMRCAYCTDNTHLTNECPGLKHNNASARAFKVRLGWICRGCEQAPHAGRKLFSLPQSSDRLCGDCMANRCAGGVSLEKQALPALTDPLLPGDCHAWETPGWEGVG